MPTRTEKSTKVDSAAADGSSRPPLDKNEDSSDSSSSSSSDSSDDEYDVAGEEASSIFRISAGQINKFFICQVCNGYLLKAHTINECLHTFCLRCIPRDGDRVLKCPTCNKKPSKKFDDAVIPDRTLQNMVDTFFSSLFQNETQQEEEFYKKRGIKRKRTDISASKAPSKQDTSNPHSNLVSNEDVCFQLISHPNSNLASLPKPYLRTSGQLRTIHLKKYLIKKLNLTPDANLQILCNEEVIGKEHSLLFIEKSRWVGEKDHLTLHYRLAGSK